MLRCPGRHPNETHKQLFPRPVLLLCLLTFTGLFAACKKISTLPLGTFAPPTADEVPATKAPSTTEAATTEAATDEAAPEVRGTGVVSFCLTVTDLEKKTK